jgi:hypothetical protein
MYGMDRSISTDFESRTSGDRSGGRADTRYLPNGGSPAINIGLSADHRAGDEGTTDFLSGLMQIHEKTAWMLCSYLR